MSLFHYTAICLLALLVGGRAMAVPERLAEAAEVVVVVNANDPDSLAIGRHYAAQRGIPEANLIALDAPTTETISLREYVDRIHNPLLNRLLEMKWVRGVKQAEPGPDGRERLLVVVHKIRFLVTVRGIPLRFENDPALLGTEPSTIPAALRHNRGSVDSELALLTGPPGLSMTAFVPNPYFEKAAVTGNDAHRVIKVSRLDGPTPVDVIRLIDRTLEAEREGLMGRAYIDSGGPHKAGDVWFEAARDVAKAAYFDTDFDGTKRQMGFEDRLDAPAIYMGWYRQDVYGPWRIPRWSVPPGAIGFHLHSFSATTVRSAKKGWLGPLVAQGYAATFGNVYEPYLEYTHRPQVVLEHLLDGGFFGDAVMQANPVLSWQGVAIGDPLYRPFAVGLDDQLAGARESVFGSYVVLRLINRLLAEDSPEAALAAARTHFTGAPSLPLALRLSELFESAGQGDKAIETLKFIRYLDVFALDELVLVRQIADRLHRLGDTALALEVYEKMLSSRDLPKPLRLTLLEGGVVVAEAVPGRELAFQWSLEARQLKGTK